MFGSKHKQRAVELDQELKSTKEELERVQTDLSEKITQSLELQVELSNQRHRAEDAETECQQLREENTRLSDASRKVQELQAQLTDERTRRGNVERQLARSRDRCNQLEQEKDALSQKVGEQSTQLEMSAEMLSNLQSDLKHAKLQITEMGTANSAASQSTNTSDATTIRQLQSKVAKLEQHRDQLVGKKMELLSRIGALESQLQSAGGGTSGTPSSVEEELVAVRRQLSSTMQEIEDLERAADQHAEREQQLSAEVKTLKDALEAEKAEKAELMTEQELLIDEVNKAAQDEEEVALLREELKLAKDELSSLRTRLSAAQQEALDAREAAAKSPQAHNDMSVLQAELNELQTQAEILQAELDEARRDGQQARHDADTVRNELNQLRTLTSAQEMEHTEELRTAQTAARKAEAETQRLREQLKKQEQSDQPAAAPEQGKAAPSDWEDQVAKAQALAQRRMDQVAEMRTRLQVLQHETTDQISTLQRQNADLKQKLSEKIDTLEALQKTPSSAAAPAPAPTPSVDPEQLAALEAQLEDIAYRLQDEQEQRAELQQKVDAAETEADRWHKRHDALQQDLQAAHDKCTQLEASLAEVTEEAEELRTQLSEAPSQEDFDELKAREAELEDELGTLNEEYAAANERENDLSLRVSELESQLSRMQLASVEEDQEHRFVRLEEELEKSQQQVEDLKAELKQAQTVSSSGHETAAADPQTELKELRAELIETATRLEEQEAEAFDLTQDLDQAQKNIKALTDEKEQLAQELAKTQAAEEQQRAEVRRLGLELQAVRRQAEEHDTERSRLAQRVQEMERAATEDANGGNPNGNSNGNDDALQSQIFALHEELNNSADEVQQYEARMMELQQELDEAKRRIEDYKRSEAEESDVSARLRDTEQELEELRRTVAQHEQELHAKATALETHKRQHSTLQDHHTALQQQLSSVESRVNQLDTEKRGLLERVDTVTQRAEQLGRERKLLEEALELERRQSQSSTPKHKTAVAATNGHKSAAKSPTSGFSFTPNSMSVARYNAVIRQLTNDMNALLVSLGSDFDWSSVNITTPLADTGQGYKQVEQVVPWLPKVSALSRSSSTDSLSSASSQIPGAMNGKSAVASASEKQLRAQYKEAQAKIDSLEQQVTRLKAGGASSRRSSIGGGLTTSLRADKYNLVKKVAELEQAIEAHSMALANKEEALTEAKSTVASLKKEKTDLQELLGGVAGERDGLLASMKELEDMMAALEARNQAVQARLSHLAKVEAALQHSMEELASTRHQANELRDKSSAQAQSIEEKDAEIKQLQEQCQQLEKKTAATAKQWKTSIDALIQQSQQLSATTEQQLTEQVATKTQQYTEQIASLRSALATAQQAGKKHAQGNVDMQAELRDLRQQCTELQDTKQQHERALEDAANTESSLRLRLKEVESALRSTKDELRELQTQMEAHAQSGSWPNSDQEAKLTELHAQLQKMQKQVQYQAQNSSIARLRKRMESMISEHSERQRELEDALSTAEQSISDLTQERDVLARKLNDMATEKQLLHARQLKSVDRLRDVQSLEHTLTARNEELQAVLDDTRSELQEAEQTNSSLKAQVETLEADVLAARQEIRRLGDLREQSQLTGQELESRMVELQDEVSAAAEEVKQRDQRIAVLNDRFSAAHVEHDAAVEAYEATIAQQQATVQRLEDTVSELTRDREELRDRCKNGGRVASTLHRAQLPLLAQHLQGLQRAHERAMTQWHTQLEESQAECNRWRDTCDQLQEELDAARTARDATQEALQQAQHQHQLLTRRAKSTSTEHLATVSQLATQVEELTAARDTAQQLADDRADELARVRDKCHGLTQGVAGFQQLFSELRKSLTQRQEEVAQLSHSLKEHKTRTMMLEEARRVDKEQLEQRDARIAELEQEASDAAQTHAELQETLRKAEDEQTALRQALVTANAKSEALQKRVKAELRTVRNNFVTELQDKLQQLGQQHSAVVEEYAQAQKTMEERLDSKAQQCNDLRQEVASRDQRLEELESELEESNSTRASLQQQLSASLSECNQRAEQLQALSEQVDTLLDQQAERDVKSSQTVSDLKWEKRALEQRNTELMQNVKSLLSLDKMQLDMQELQTQVEQRMRQLSHRVRMIPNVVAASVTVWRQRVAVLDEQRERLLAELSSTQDQVHELTAANTSHEHSIASLTEAQQKLQLELEDVTSKLSKTTQQRDGLADQLAVAQQHAEALAAQIQRVETEHKALGAQLDTESSMWHSKAEQSAAENDRLNRLVAELEQEKAQLESKLSETEQSLAQWQEKHGNTNEALESARANIRQLEAQQLSLQRDIAAQEERAQSAQLSSSRSIERLEAAVKQHSQALEKARAREGTANRRICELGDQLNETKLELGRSQAEVQRTHGLLADLRAEHTRQSRSLQQQLTQDFEADKVKLRLQQNAAFQQLEDRAAANEKKLREQVRDMTTRMFEQNAEFTRMEEELASAQETVKSLTERNKTLTSQLSDYEEEVARATELDQEVKLCHSRLSEQMTELNALSAQVNTLTRERDGAVSQVTVLDRELRAARADVKDAHRRADSYEEQVTDASRRVADAERVAAQASQDLAPTMLRLQDAQEELHLLKTAVGYHPDDSQYWECLAQLKEDMSGQAPTLPLSASTADSSNSSRGTIRMLRQALKISQAKVSDLERRLSLMRDSGKANGSSGGRNTRGHAGKGGNHGARSIRAAADRYIREHAADLKGIPFYSKSRGSVYVFGTMTVSLSLSRNLLHVRTGDRVYTIGQFMQRFASKEAAKVHGVNTNSFSRTSSGNLSGGSGRSGDSTVGGVGNGTAASAATGAHTTVTPSHTARSSLSPSAHRTPSSNTPRSSTGGDDHDVFEQPDEVHDMDHEQYMSDSVGLNNHLSPPSALHRTFPARRKGGAAGGALSATMTGPADRHRPLGYTPSQVSGDQSNHSHSPHGRQRQFGVQARQASTRPFATTAPVKLARNTSPSQRPYHHD